MPTKRTTTTAAPRTPRSRKVTAPAAMPAPHIHTVALRRLEVLTLFFSFVLALICMHTVKVAAQATSDIRTAKIDIHNLSLQRSHLRSELSHLREDQVIEAPEQEPGPTVLTAVVKFRDGELEEMQRDLIVPLLTYYGLFPDQTLKAVLVERKNAASRNVNLRLFMEDGTETTYLWPDTHATKGVWDPQCAMTVEEVGNKKPTLCPEGYNAGVTQE